MITHASHVLTRAHFSEADIGTKINTPLSRGAWYLVLSTRVKDVFAIRHFQGWTRFYTAGSRNGSEGLLWLGTRTNS